MEFNKDNLHPETLSVIGGYDRQDSIDMNSLAAPIFSTTAFPFESAEEAERICQEEEGLGEGYIYTRTDNPTTRILAERISLLSGDYASLITSSGMAAVFTTVFSLTKEGGEAVASNRTYSATYSLFREILPERGVKTTHIDSPADLSEWEDAVTDDTELFYIETPSNPGLHIIDIEKLAALAHANDILLVVDNTNSTPVLQKPLELGADIVVHSTSKYISGYSNVQGGSITAEKEFISSIKREEYIAIGSCPSPFNSWLTLIGLETLPARMEKHSQNGRKVAEYLNDHPDVSRVNYPGLKEHPRHEIARAQMEDFGGLLSFAPKSEAREDVYTFLNSLNMIPYATHTGCSRTVVCFSPVTHYNVYPEAELEKMPELPMNLIRLQVGLEKAEDIIKDIEQALDKI